MLVGAAIYTIMTTWHGGIEAMHRGQERDALTIAQFLASCKTKSPARAGPRSFSPGCAAIFRR